MIILKSVSGTIRNLPQIHNEWMKAEYAISQVSEDLEIRILKTIAIIRMIHKEEELPAKEEIFRLSLGCEEKNFNMQCSS